MNARLPCPCGSERSYDDCCGRFISGDTNAPTALALMKSRYSAYVKKEREYLLRTWHKSTCPPVLDLQDDGVTKWIGLDIKRTEKGSEHDDYGIVEFIAKYKINGKAHKMHEVSEFVKEDGYWFYVKPI